MKTFIVDSFTDRPFRGNPAGVCLVTDADRSPDPERMLHIAQELNLSETAFVMPTVQPGVFNIRFFSPKVEIPLCGHATLASGKIVMDDPGKSPTGDTHGLSEVRFTNIQDLELRVKKVDGGLEMQLPAFATQPAEAPPALLRALGLEAIENAAYNAETEILLLEIDDAVTLGGLKPDFPALLGSHDSINGVLVTAPAGQVGQGDADFDFHSRYFWPWSGTNEDPVTGGTHTFLAGYWAERLGKTRLRSFQASERTGSMTVEVGEGAVRILAQAVTVFEGNLIV